MTHGHAVSIINSKEMGGGEKKSGGKWGSGCLSAIGYRENCRKMVATFAKMESRRGQRKWGLRRMRYGGERLRRGRKRGRDEEEVFGERLRCA